MSIKKHIPNTLTCCNLLSGCVAVVAALDGMADWALFFIIVGAVFDFFDGFSARLLGVSSPIGLELDSLADDVTFGVAPASIVFVLLSNCFYPDWLAPVADYVPYAAFLIAAFSALRLAKFNLDERQHTSFIGLPSPANALFWGGLACSLPYDWMFVQSPALLFVLLALVAASCWLLVSEIPMFSLKFKTFRPQDNVLRYSFLLAAVALIALLGVAAGLAFSIVLYFLLSLVAFRR